MKHIYIVQSLPWTISRNFSSSKTKIFQSLIITPFLPALSPLQPQFYFLFPRFWLLCVSHICQVTQYRSFVWLVYFTSIICSSNISQSVQSLNRVRLFATPWIAARQASLSITISWSSLRLTSIESVMPSSHLIPCRPLLLLPPIPPSIRVFSNLCSGC